MNPDLGRRAAEENQNEIRNALNGADMVFLTCGLGGGTGTGAVGEVAKLAKDIGALTVAVVTKPFAFEGAQRRRIAEEGFNQLIQYVDTVITIPNDRVLQIIDKKTSLIDAFNIVDDVLRQGVQGISELITIPGLINVDFADVKAIMENAGSALMGIGRASGENRAVEAAKQAIASPLLELSVDGAKGISTIVNKDFKKEVQRAREVYNQAWEKNWGFVPLTEAEITALRGRAALQARIHELAHLGGLPPMRVPIDMNLSTYRLTTDDEIMVVSGESSGELELDDPVPRRTIRTSHRVTVPPQHI